MFEPIECDLSEMEAAANAKTLFYGRIGSNTVWGFQPANGARGVAITDGRSGQAVVSVNNLQAILERLTSAA